MREQIDGWVDRQKENIIEMYQFLHNNAEISWEEVKTTQFIKNELEKLSISYELFNDQTGIVGVWGEGNAPVVGLRADMDALWQQVKGKWKANHSCGHDAHTTILLFTLRCLKELGFEPKERLSLFFSRPKRLVQGQFLLLIRGF